jgi:outer membrane protein assembly factor BamB
VFLSSGYGTGAAVLDLSGDQPREVWRHKKMRNMLNSSVLVNGFIFGIDGDVKNRSTGLNCVDPRTGAVKWAANETSVGGGSLTAADGKLIVLSETGELIVAEASADSFKPLARARILGGKCWTAPVLSGGRIFARNAVGDLVCVVASGQ